MKLYSHPGTCSSAVHIILNEIGQNFEIINFNVFDDDLLPDGRFFSDINPKGAVPVLELESGEIITENVAILQYIADLYPENDLAPANGTLERVRLQEWLSFLNDFHYRMGVFFVPYLEGKMRESADQRLGVYLVFLNTHLNNNKYLMGEHFTVADAYLYVILSWAKLVEKDISQHKHIITFQQTLEKRQSIRSILPDFD